MKSVKGKWYTVGHWVRHNPPLVAKGINGREEYFSRTYETNDDGFLYANGNKLANIKREDLPEWYMYGRFMKRFGFINTKDIVDIYYRSSKITILKDDSLYVSYKDKIITHKDNYGYDTPDSWYIIVDGWDMVKLLAYLTAYNKREFPIEEFLTKIENKIKWFKENHLNDIENDRVKVEDVMFYYNEVLNKLK